MLSLPLNQILLGDCLEILKTLPDASVDAVVTDPPYGLGPKEPTMEEIVAYLNGSELDTGGDFMGRDWSIPPVAVWKECLRVLKPGGHLLSFGGTRTFDLISIGIRAAGFDSRDTVASFFGSEVLAWLHGQGFPKSLNISKALEKAGAPPEVVERWRGYGTALKPAWEPILVFRKPLEGTVLENVTEHLIGGFSIDALRIGQGTGGGRDGELSQNKQYSTVGSTNFAMTPGPRGGDARGRWPANIILVHAHDCKVVGTQKVPAPVINRFDDGMKPFGDGAGHAYTSTQTGDADGMEEIPVYECVDGCPVKMLDDQSGMTTSGAMKREVEAYEGESVTGFLRGRSGPSNQHGGSGGASRFFGQIQPDAPFLYTGKVSRRERNEGIVRAERDDYKDFVFLALREDVPPTVMPFIESSWPKDLPPPDSTSFREDQVPDSVKSFFEEVTLDSNKHPTVKPKALMQWLVKLVAPKDAVVLDPYCGSGTTCMAAWEVGCQFIGIDRDPIAKETAERRVKPLLDRGREPAFFDLMEGLPSE